VKICRRTGLTQRRQERELAAELGEGLVYDPSSCRKATRREVSDGLLIVGDRGLILSQARTGAGTSQDKAKVLMQKRPEAERQVVGTHFDDGGHPPELVSHRGHERS
jgi:hypothetical protein